MIKSENHSPHKFKEVVLEQDLEFGCIEKSEQHVGKAFGMLEAILVVKETQEEFLALLK